MPLSAAARQAVAQAIREADATGNGIVEDDFQEMISRWALSDKTVDGKTIGAENTIDIEADKLHSA